MLGELFARSSDPESFRAAVASLGGDFVFDTGEMIGLGEAYFRKHPDTSHKRDRESVLVGYELVRICAGERLVRRLGPAGREFYRAAFRDATRVGSLSAPFSAGELSADLAVVEAEMARIREAIEGIPKGPVKERFVGGISHLCTVLYLVRLHLGQRGTGPGAGPSGGARS